MQNTFELINNVSRQIRVYPADYHKFGQHWVFGPSYRAEEGDFSRDAKKEALDLLLNKLECTLQELLSALNDIEEVKAAYPVDALEKMDSVNFQVMMAMDGCFFLLVAFSILGEGSLGIELKFPDNHPIFGIGCVREDMNLWLSSMFFVGNQIPFIVLKQLMELRFFQELKMNNKWEQPPELAKKAIYKLLITEHDQNPVDLIHCLQSLMPRTRSGTRVPMPIMGNYVCDEIVDVPSAKRLREQGIAIEALDEGLSSRGVYYKRGFFNAVLYLPIFKVDRYTEIVVECLCKYEMVQSAKGIEPESSPYIKLLSELIGTQEDVEELSSQGVIQGRAEGLLAILKNFDGMASCDHLRHVRREIKENRPRLWWKHRRLICFISFIPAIFLFIFAFLQTDYTVLGYYKRGHP